MPIPSKAIAAFACLGLLAACHNLPVSPPPAAAPPQSYRSGFSQVGIASWYGPGFRGNRTADGERFNLNALTAAHRTLPFNSYVRVTDLASGRSVVVRINDRGPFAGNRIIDLSARAARELGIADGGTARVRLDLVDEGRLDAADGAPAWSSERR